MSQSNCPIGRTMSEKSDRNYFLTANIKALLQEKLWLLDERFRKKRLITDYKMLTESESRILATLRGETLTISEIARRLALSRQAVHRTITRLVQRELLQMEPVPGNARDKRIVFTEKGEAMKLAGSRLLREIEQEIESRIGKDNFTILKSILNQPW